MGANDIVLRILPPAMHLDTSSKTETFGVALVGPDVKLPRTAWTRFAAKRRSNITAWGGSPGRKPQKNGTIRTPGSPERCAPSELSRQPGASRFVGLFAPGCYMERRFAAKISTLKLAPMGMNPWTMVVAPEGGSERPTCILI